MTKQKDMRQYAEFAEKEIGHICSAFEKREPGSKGERDAQEYLAAEIKNNGWADNVTLQAFKVAPRAFLFYTKLIPILMAIGFGLYFIHPISSFIFSAVSTASVVSQLLFYRIPFKIFFRRKTSLNLSAARSSTGKTKRRIIINGHIDAAYEWSLGYYFGYKFAKVVVALSVLGLFAYVALGLWASININFEFWIRPEIDYSIWKITVLAAFLPVYFVLFFFCNYKRVVDGANDNLSGSLAAVAIIKYLADNNIEFENTEVAAVITGSEECGLRGARAYVKQNREMLLDPDVETVFICLETLEEIKYLAIYNKDMNGLVKLNPRAVSLLDKAAAVHCDKPLPHASIPLGASDAAALAKGGVPAVTLAAMSPAPAPYYHTRDDDPSRLNINCIEKALDICLTAVEIFDKNGLG